MDPPSIETISKYIFQPLREPPPPPQIKLPPIPSPNTIAATASIQKESAEQKRGPLSLTSVIQHDKHDSPLLYLRLHPLKAQKSVSPTNSDKSTTPNSTHLAQASAVVEPATINTFTLIKPFKLKHSHEKCICNGRPLLSSIVPRPANYDPDLHHRCNFQLSRMPNLSNTARLMKLASNVDEPMPRPNKSVKKLISSKRRKKAVASERPAAANQVKAETSSKYHSASSTTAIPPSSSTQRAPVQSFFFDPIVANDIARRPGYAEVLTPEEDWTIPIMSHQLLGSRSVDFDDASSTNSPPLIRDEVVLEPGGSPRYVQLLSDMEWDNAMHKRWTSNKYDCRRGKEAVWPLWSSTYNDEKKNVEELRKVALSMWDQAIALNRGIVQYFTASLPVWSDKLEEQQRLETEVMLRRVMKLHSSPKSTQNKDEDDDDKTIVPVQSLHDEDYVCRGDATDHTHGSANGEDTDHDQIDKRLPRGKENIGHFRDVEGALTEVAPVL